MTRGRHHTGAVFAVLVALACAVLGASAWQPATASAVGGSDRTAAGPVTPAPPVLDDVMGGGDGSPLPDLPIGLGVLPGARETAAFAAGRVAVGVVFLESDGSIMTSSEDWTTPDPDYPAQDRRQLVLAKVQGALDWWNARSPDGSLELFLPAAGAYGAPQTASTGYEPIRRGVALGWRGRPVLSDAAWRWQAMGRLGFAHDATDDTPAPETLFADRLRRRNGADWAFVVYVVDSLQDADGMFRLALAGGEGAVADRVLLATGGGKDSAGVAIAQSLGHAIEPPVPSLLGAANAARCSSRNARTAGIVPRSSRWRFFKVSKAWQKRARSAGSFSTSASRAQDLPPSAS